ncbi:similar to Saccharomyces cerevisiae YJR041C URB2 Nucleolar protein required for normal metabolism of the rRNA primary transcript, proposed to be involved in ribosome biogenesis [Maudiozyma barnettii]|uniref:Similar to Saccharomyces cerevisiae YJR041C URB2 Nucleolar protein required for normal metabolism of the rRNA primary transcript, proposed to be involved in ribosome biogenesis n=1 Tax=Maudiozyma barnettii TaxID=61262 RepID=A0A8H2ZHH5_9SACH|nr:Urb2p [Kazachstania barnettii]CAB4255774.1 similar to Saccharomyces cerevisiae YJR041C URB2 Nucleolar protein required for normal metabolism of the rRNA primary transcript, proposed to be involved in ribosome biogenesis [Kazachstania barnettii]CAD1784335.1 similar to Saccharomyces cerevisiae YJR041C URB2 Nucleolar protein required for normal metabolism of the rRNA primary transcript, proposed to be involved in ribosome biogenesis [Kazachstania barnettii]
MSFPTSAEGITKLLRAKDTSPDEICNTIAGFTKLDFFFPNKEIFVLELIEDRWNDQKKVEFKNSYQIWNIFNDMWLEVNDDVILKKLFKQLKFTALLQHVLSSSDIDATEMAMSLLKTCRLINATSTVEISFEQSCSILSNTILLVLKTDLSTFNDEKRNLLIQEIITLIGFDNLLEINHKLSIVFCNELLLSILRYLAYCNDNNTVDSNHNMAKKFSTYLGKYLFGRDINPLLLLDKFFQRNKIMIGDSVATILFEESNKYVAKNDFTKLETIFENIIAVQPSVVVKLLQLLSSSKKTMSHDFLEKLFVQTVDNARSTNIYDSTFWNLLGHLLELDLEIGIQKSSTLMSIIEEQKASPPVSEVIFDIWKKFLNCYINAREYPKFLKLFEKYCYENKTMINTSIFLIDQRITHEIIKNIATLSISQLKETFTAMVAKVTSIEVSEMTTLISKIYLKSLPLISYIILPDLKEIFSPLFTDTIESGSEIWELRYLVMQIYDDIIPDKLLSVVAKTEITSIFKMDNKLSRDQLFFILKLREYKDFDISMTESKLLQYLEDIDDLTKRETLQELFVNWSSLMNSLFSRETISKLVNILISDNCISILEVLFGNDDIFEENNVMNSLVFSLTSEDSINRTIPYLLQIPLECLNKNVRISLINNITNKNMIRDIDLRLLDHLLSSPTFKSQIENHFDTLLKIMECPKLATTNVESEANLIFEKVLRNHISQSKESISRDFLQLLKNKIMNGINNERFIEAYFTMAVLFIQCTNINDRDSLVNLFIDKSTEWISKFNAKNDDFHLSLVANKLYYALKDTDISKETSTRISSFIRETMKHSQISMQQMTTSSLPLFLLYTFSFDERLEIIFSQYLILRDNGISKTELLPAIENIVTRKSLTDENGFNNALISTIVSLKDETTNKIYRAILELLQVQMMHINKENIIGPKLFVKFISEVFTNITHFEENPQDILEVCNLICELQVSKSWIFSQYGIEILFPFCLKVNLLNRINKSHKDMIFIACTKIISNILNFSRIKVSNRNNLVNSLLCEYLELICNSKKYGLSAESATAFSRVVVNYCEPSNASSARTRNNNKLSSNTSVFKKTVRKYIPAFLIKYIYLCISSTFDDIVRKCITPAIYAILDLISQNELNMINRVLDNSGRQYFRVLYADYKKLGKWHES